MEPLPLTTGHSTGAERTTRRWWLPATRTRASGRRLFVLHVALPMVIGGLIYLLWRPQTLLVFHWLQGLGLDGVIGAWRAALGPAPAALPAWVVYSLPNTLWIYAFTWQLVLVWRDVPSRWGPVWLTVPLVLGAGAELGQLGPVPGTFDWVDLTTCVAGSGVALGWARCARALKWRGGDE